MNAESILKSVSHIIGSDRLDNQVNSQDFETRQVVEIMNESAIEIAKRGEWGTLTRIWDIFGNVKLARLPQDWDRMCSTGSVYDRGTGVSVPVVSDPELWCFLERNVSRNLYCHLMDGALYFSSTIPESGVSSRYQRKGFLTSGKEKITESSDELVIPGELVIRGTIWRWRRQKGLPFEDTLSEYEAAFVNSLKADRGIS